MLTPHDLHALGNVSERYVPLAILASAAPNPINTLATMNIAIFRAALWSAMPATAMMEPQNMAGRRPMRSQTKPEHPGARQPPIKMAAVLTPIVVSLSLKYPVYSGRILRPLSIERQTPYDYRDAAPLEIIITCDRALDNIQSRQSSNRP